MSDLDREIFNQLKRLGNEAPQAPRSGQIHFRLRRRTIRRSVIASTTFVVLAGVIAFSAVGMFPSESSHGRAPAIAGNNAAPLPNPGSNTPDNPPDETPPPVIVDVGPLAPDAAPSEVRSALREYLGERGISRAVLQKSPEDGLSWSVTASSKLDETLFQAELRMLLKNCDYAEIDFSPKAVSYSLLRYENPDLQRKGTP
ncbi:hypothetical protein OAU50_05370 [Planctomycetota bacterium]|nr:hypothetical protein [Planctomycetota bacterium]